MSLDIKQTIGSRSASALDALSLEQDPQHWQLECILCLLTSLSACSQVVHGLLASSYYTRVHTFDDLFHFVSFRFVPFRFVPFRVLSLAVSVEERVAVTIIIKL